MHQDDSASERPDPQDYGYDLDRALVSVVGLRTHIPADAFTAEVLGTERAGHGVVIRSSGLVLTIGYLVAEAETVWITLADGRALPGHVLSYEYETGFGLVQALARLDLPALPLGRSAAARVGDPVVLAGAGGLEHAVAARITARREFAGYWEYVLDEAFFTAPAHPNWGGTAMIGGAGELLGIGSLLIQTTGGGAAQDHQNMVVPIDFLKPILDDMASAGQPARPPRPWLGLYATEIENRIVVAGVASRGPAARARLEQGDVVLGVNGQEVSDLADFFRRIWSLGEAGVAVPMQVYREGRAFEVTVNSADRRSFLKSPVAH